MCAARNARAEILIGRQPIFNRQLSVVGYELLFRSGAENHAGVHDAEEATATVVMGALTEIGLERLVAGSAAWINVSREFVLGGFVEAMPASLTVLEVLEDQVIDDELINALRALRRSGYRIALDDFTSSPESDRLLPIADIVKLDVRELGRAELERQAARLGRTGVTVLAEKVESHAEHAWCAAAGCELFQGYFFCKPEVLRDWQLAPGRLSLLEFISVLQDPSVEFAQLEQLITRDLVLSYRLLCYVNSAFFGLRQRVSSITQALVLLGVENLRRWATLSLFASIDGKPQELTVTGLLRARFCELAGAGLPGATPGELFTLGLFSVIDALMDAPIEQIVEATPFPQDMCEALIARRGEKGRLLECVVALEAGRFDEAQDVLPGSTECYLDAILWAGEAAQPLFEATEAAAA
jgi:c-di-GMP phosphodiesterase